MPLGSAHDPHSALGVIHGLGANASIVFASHGHSNIDNNGHDVVGCVLGTILDDEVIRAYGLEPFGAQSGDGLLAYIGIVPEAQGTRLHAGNRRQFSPTRRQAGASAPSLARHLFDRWMGIRRIRDCPRLFIRTRRRIRPVVHLCESSGFEYCGAFELDFRGERQRRLVYRRANAAAGSTMH